jgi:predicted transposase YdaD
LREGVDKNRYTDYNVEEWKYMSEMCKVMEDLRNESYAEGQAEGREQQAKDTAIRMNKKGRSVEEIADCIDFDVEIVRKWLAPLS